MTLGPFRLGRQILSLEPLATRLGVVRTICFLVLASCVMAFVVTFTRNQLLGWLLLGVEIVGVVAVHSSFVGRRGRHTSFGAPHSTALAERQTASPQSSTTGSV